MANKTEFLVLRVTPEVKERLQTMANKIYEPVSLVVRAIIDEKLAQLDDKDGK